MCAALRRIAHLGINVILVLHQPRYALAGGVLFEVVMIATNSYEIFTRFDDVLLLGKGGKTVYLGPTEQVRATQACARSALYV